MFLGWKNQYCPNDYSTTQDSTDTLQSLSNYNAFFTELGKKKSCIETQKPLNGQSNPEKAKQTREESGSLTSGHTIK